MSFTYAELKQALQDYTENTESSFVSNLPLFIRLSEERILKSVQLNLFQKNQYGTMTSGNQYLACPSDFLAPMSLSYDVAGDANFLLFKDLDFVQTYTPDPTTTGEPKYYAQFDVDNFILGPTPDAEIALLYCALVECYTYMKGDPQLMQMYMQRAGEALSRMKNLGEAQEINDEYRTGKILRQKT
jgi:hypothetical protein